MASPAALVLRLAIRLYQAVFRPVLGPNCRFTPSCSDYAIEAIQLHGAVHGSGLAVRRIVRCNPWCAGGHDPVPAQPSPRPKSPPYESPAAR